MDHYIFDGVVEMNNLPKNQPAQKKPRNKIPPQKWGRSQNIIAEKFLLRKIAQLLAVGQKYNGRSIKTIRILLS